MNEAINPKLAPHNEFNKCDEMLPRNMLFPWTSECNVEELN